MKIVSLGTLCCLVIITLSTRVLSDEYQNINSEWTDCKQQAIDAGANPGEEFDLFVADCELYESAENIIEEDLPVESFTEADLERFK